MRAAARLLAQGFALCLLVGSGADRAEAQASVPQAAPPGAAMQAAAETPTRPQRRTIGVDNATSFLWVGNSFFYSNNSLHSHVEALARAADPRSAVRGVSVTISGSGLGWHDLDSYFRPDAIGAFTFTAANEVVFKTDGPKFDAVVMMDCSQCPIHPRLAALFHTNVQRQSAVALRHGARPVLFMSWAYADQPGMAAPLAEQYTRAGNANDALVIPAGLAFANALALRPEIGLHQTDRRHPSMRGTYLAACTAYAALFGVSPIGNAHTAGIDPAIATFLQTVAWDTVQAYLESLPAEHSAPRRTATPWH